MKKNGLSRSKILSYIYLGYDLNLVSKFRFTCRWSKKAILWQNSSCFKRSFKKIHLMIVLQSVLNVHWTLFRINLYQI